MTALLIGYARCSTDQQDLTAQRDGLAALGVAANRVYVDHGLTGTNRERPGLREALAACREGDTLVVTKLDRLARSLPDARAIADELTVWQFRLNLGGSVYDPTDPVGWLLFNVLAMVAEFESDLIRLRTREGIKVAKARVVCAASSPNSINAKKRTWWPCSKAASTAPLSSPTCSASPARLSTGQLVEHVSSLYQGARLDQSSVEESGTEAEVLSRPATSLDTTRSCGSRQIPRPGTDEKFWNGHRWSSVGS